MSWIDAATPRSVEQLEDALSLPPQYVIQSLARLKGNLLILGVGGKMGPTLARMARRAMDAAGSKGQVIGVSRFTAGGLQQRLEGWRVKTLAADLLDERAVAALPDAETVIFMTGMKFGSSANPALTWAMNCYVPALVSRRYRDSRIGVFSSGNVYGLVPVTGRGSTERDEPRPLGEYAITVLGRERMFEYFCREWRMPVVLLRLNYATELRYGVLTDLARQVWAGEPVDVSMGYVNVIWQREANALALAALEHATSGPLILNLAGPEVLRIRSLCERFAELMGKEVDCVGREAGDALLSDASRCCGLIARPTVTAAEMVRWTADWVMHGGESLGKPTHFQSRDGRF